ncbi:MAG: 2-oxoglutarate dehydrogenase E1 component [Polyangia bacterium]
MEPSDQQLVALLGANLRYLDEISERHDADPRSVEPSFQSLLSAGSVRLVPSTPAPAATARAADGAVGAAAGAATGKAAAGEDAADCYLRLRVRDLISAYRRYGHTLAQLDPIGLAQPTGHPELALSEHGLSEEDLPRTVRIDEPTFTNGGQAMTVAAIVEHLKHIYCGPLAVEVEHIEDPERRAFIREHIERSPGAGGHYTTNPEEQIQILRSLLSAEALEQFIHTKFVGAKRFSLEGGKTLIPLLHTVFEQSGDAGVKEIVIGMAHRGRLNVLANLLSKSPRLIFAEFEDLDPQSVMGAGDVKYHMGYSTDWQTRRGNKMHLSLAFNPSHLEAVDPVVVGRVRAKQRRLNDKEHNKVLGVLVHGDAAFAGQGLVAETLQLSELEGYTTGGTFHVIVNNQIGFTTDPRDSRSTRYCTDIAKMLQAPILHVNGNDPEAVLHAAEVLLAYQRRFHSDVLLDMVCFRRYGHNESDEPSFTQPLMYQHIERQLSVPQAYARRVIERGVFTKAQLDEMLGQIHGQLEADLKAAKSTGERPRVEAFTGVWRGYSGGFDRDVPDVETAVPMERLSEIARAITQAPPGFTVHPKIERLLGQRAAMGRGEQPLDWGMGEHLAFGSLLAEGRMIRVSGQDSRRGTFSQRHAALYDQRTGERYVPLANLGPQQGEFQIFDSMLSEAAVLGFEYGFSLDYPDCLVIWEAQFGDFVNGAQVILDQFVSSAEDKWRRLSGLTLLLPHGYEGQGPEHSSARFERFLQLCAEDNMQVVYPTTPAQYFHLLRRQVLRPWRKPLVIMSPKSLLRLPAATSPLGDLSTGSFRCVLGDPQADPKQVRRIIICTGKVYYDLVEHRKKHGHADTAIVRLEQLYPLRTSELNAELDRFGSADEIIWVQEEPANMGALGFIAPRLYALAGSRRVRLCSRLENASPATGSYKAHVLEHQQLLSEAFGPPSTVPGPAPGK